jgi:DNA invertase Pin-like site-specific DNA recombinase
MSDRSSLCLAGRVAIYTRTVGTSAQLPDTLRRTVEDRGGVAVSTFHDNAKITGRGKYAGWRKLLAHLDAVDQIVVSNAGDIPGRTIADLLKVLAILRDHDVGLYLYDEQIDTGSTGFALLDIITAYRTAKLSQAIRNGQAKALAAGKRIGRPGVPGRVQDRIRAALAQGGGVRPTARQFNVSPASVINIRRGMAAV